MQLRTWQPPPGNEADDAARERIAALGQPADDPVGGDGIELWSTG